MNHVYESQEFGFYWDQISSQKEGRPVSNFWTISHSFQQSILFPNSTTAGFTVWVNNSRPKLRSVDPAHILSQNMDYYDVVKYEQINPSFSSNWVNISSDPCVTYGASAIYIGNTFRYIRLENSNFSSTGSFSATTTANTMAQMFSSNSEPGQ